MTPETGRMARWHARVRELKTDMQALFLACRDARVPWQAKAVAFLVVAYAVSPIDLIPDFIPVLGYLDDLVILPLGILLALRMIPPEVMQDCRCAAREATTETKTGVLAGALLVLTIWAVILAATLMIGRRWIS